MQAGEPYSVVEVTPPAEEPITLAEAKAHLRVLHDEDDALIERCIAAARQNLERWLTFVETTWRMYLDAFPCDGEIVLTRPPVQSVTSVEYMTVAGAWATVSSGDYQVSAGRQPPRIWPAVGKSWPGPRTQPEAVRVTYVAGFDDAAAVPAAYKAPVLLMMAHLYEVREPTITGTIVAEMPMTVKRLINGLRHGWR